MVYDLQGPCVPGTEPAVKSRLRPLSCLQLGGRSTKIHPGRCGSKLPRVLIQVLVRVRDEGAGGVIVHTLRGPPQVTEKSDVIFLQCL